MEEKNTKKSFWLYLIISIAVVILGIFMIIFPTLSVDIFFKIIGVVVCVTGIITIISFLIKKHNNYSVFELISGIIVLFIGIILLFATDAFVGIITLFLGITFTMYSCLALAVSIFTRSLNKYWIVLFIISIVCFSLSIAIIVNGKNSLGILFGITLVSLGVLSTILVLYIKSKYENIQKVFLKKQKEGKNQNNDDVIETSINE